MAEVLPGDDGGHGKEEGCDLVTAGFDADEDVDDSGAADSGEANVDMARRVVELMLGCSEVEMLRC